MPRLGWVLWVLLCLLPGGGTQAAARDSGTAGQVARVEHGLIPAAVARNRPLPHLSLRERMRHYQVPAVSVAFIDHGRVEWARAYGLADVAAGRPATPQTLFQAASITKPVFAVAVLKAAAEGALSLDRPVNDYLATWKLPEGALTARQPVTLRLLLSHTAGLNLHGFAGYPGGTLLFPTLPQILSGKPPANNEALGVVAEPGGDVMYSGGGYVLAGLVMTETRHEPLPDIIRRAVLDPAGMTRSTMLQPLPPALMNDAALPYDRLGQPVPGGPYIYPEGAPDALWSTPSDLARFALAVQDAYAGRSTGLMDQATAQLMISSVRDGVGLGFELGGDATRPSFSHDGMNVGYVCKLFAYRDTGQGVVVMTNGEGGALLIHEIESALAAECGWPDFRPSLHDTVEWPASTLRGLRGHYVFDDANLGAMTIEVHGGRGWVECDATGPSPVELVPQALDAFFLPDASTVVHFKAGPDGRVVTITLSMYGQDFAGHRTTGR